MRWERLGDGPILTAGSMAYPCQSVFNPGACRFGGDYLLIVRVEDLGGVSHFTLASSRDGVQFTPDPEPWVLPSTDPAWEPYERWGIEDPRVTRIGDDYYITYTAYGPHGPRGALARTRDFVDFERLGYPTEIDNKDLVFFPELIDGHYAMLDRPGGFMGMGASIWLQHSPDLIHWGRAEVVLTPHACWGRYKIGAGPPPIRTDRGWLLIFHAVRLTEAGKIYRGGVALLDLEQPSRVIAVSPDHVLAPQTEYERSGDVPNVVFPSGAIVEADGTVLVYYGAADTCIGVARTSIEEMLEACTLAV